MIQSLRYALIPFKPSSSFVKLSSTKTEWLPFEKKQYIRRRGYEPHIHTKGMAPRIPSDTKPLPEMAHEDPKDDWHETEALFGQNDYIDILGDGNIHPVRLLTNVPWWLRGFRGNELQMINRQRFAKWHFYETRPEEWDRMKKRVDWLYIFLSKHKKPPRPVKYK